MGPWAWMASERGALGNWLTALLTHEATAVALGGAAGANARYWLGKWFAVHPWSEHFPLGTVVINISGSLLLGLLSALFLERLPTPQKFWLLLLGTGFCGGYTTFSTFEFETLKLLEAGRWPLALLNVLASVIAGFAAVWFGVAVIRGSMSK